MAAEHVMTRVLIHNLGVNDLELQDVAGKSLVGRPAPPEWRERLHHRLPAALAAPPRPAIDGAESPPCILLPPAGDGFPTAWMTSSRLQGYLQDVQPDAVVLQLTTQTPARDTDTAWLGDIFRSWLGVCHHIHRVELEMYDVSRYFATPGAAYDAVSARLPVIVARHTDAEWFLTLTGGLPVMGRAMAITGLDLLPNVVLLETSEPGPRRVPRIFRSPLARALRMRPVTALVDAFDFSAAVTLAQPLLGAESPAIHLLHYASARADHRYDEARTHFEGAKALFLAQQADRIGKRLSELAAEAPHDCPERLREHVWILETLFRQGRLRAFMVELHVYLTWLFLLQAGKQLTLTWNSSGVLTSFPDHLSDYAATWSAAFVPRNRRCLGDQEDYIAETGRKRPTAPGLAGLAVLNDVSTQVLGDSLDPEAEVLLRLVLPKTGSVRGDVAHKPASVDRSVLIRTLRRYLAPETPALRDEERLALLLRTAHRKALGNRPAPLESSPFAQAARAWRRWYR